MDNTSTCMWIFYHYHNYSSHPSSLHHLPVFSQADYLIRALSATSRPPRSISQGQSATEGPSVCHSPPIFAAARPGRTATRGHSLLRLSRRRGNLRLARRNGRWLAAWRRECGPYRRTLWANRFASPRGRSCRIRIGGRFSERGRCSVAWPLFVVFRAGFCSFWASLLWLLRSQENSISCLMVCSDLKEGW